MRSGVVLDANKSWVIENAPPSDVGILLNEGRIPAALQEAAIEVADPVWLVIGLENGLIAEDKVPLALKRLNESQLAALAKRSSIPSLDIKVAQDRASRKVGKSHRLQA